MFIMYNTSYTRPITIHTRHLATSIPLFGGKAAKRRKQTMKVTMPHIPVKTNTAIPINIAITHFD